MDCLWNNCRAITRMLCKQPVSVRPNFARTATFNLSKIFYFWLQYQLHFSLCICTVYHSFTGQFAAFNLVKSNQHSPVFETAFIFSKVSRVRLFVLLVGAVMWMRTSMEHMWNGTDRGKPKYSENDVSQCYFVHRKPHKLHWSMIEPRSPRWVYGN